MSTKTGLGKTAMADALGKAAMKKGKTPVTVSADIYATMTRAIPVGELVQVKVRQGSKEKVMDALVENQDDHGAIVLALDNGKSVKSGRLQVILPGYVVSSAVNSNSNSESKAMSTNKTSKTSKPVLSAAKAGQTQPRAKAPVEAPAPAKFNMKRLVVQIAAILGQDEIPEISKDGTERYAEFDYHTLVVSSNPDAYKFCANQGTYENIDWDDPALFTDDEAEAIAYFEAEHESDESDEDDEDDEDDDSEEDDDDTDEDEEDEDGDAEDEDDEETDEDASWTDQMVAFAESVCAALYVAEDDGDGGQAHGVVTYPEGEEDEIQMTLISGHYADGQVGEWVLVTCNPEINPDSYPIGVYASKSTKLISKDLASGGKGGHWFEGFDEIGAWVDDVKAEHPAPAPKKAKLSTPKKVAAAATAPATKPAPKASPKPSSHVPNFAAYLGAVLGKAGKIGTNDKVSEKDGIIKIVRSGGLARVQIHKIITRLGQEFGFTVPKSDLPKDVVGTYKDKNGASATIRAQVSGTSTTGYSIQLQTPVHG